ncbi:MAG: PspC domain-containing protein, partial [bacterium]
MPGEKRLMRSKTDRKIFGTCAGLAVFWDTD